MLKKRKSDQLSTSFFLSLEMHVILILNCFCSMYYEAVADLLLGYCLNIILNEYICNDRNRDTLIEIFFHDICLFYCLPNS